MAITDQLIADGFIQPPVKGLLEGIDPALPDNLYAPTYSPDIENIRVASGHWETRLGMLLWKTLPGSGAPRLLDNFYKADGTRIRIAAQGDASAAVFYTLTEGTDTVFQSQAGSGGSALGGSAEPRFQGVTLGNRYYFTDRFGALRKFDPAPPDSGNKVRAVVQPAAPTAAPVVRSRTFAILDDMTAANWVSNDPVNFIVTDDTAANPPPGGGKTLKINAPTGINQTNDTVTHNVTGQLVPSHTIAFWAQQDKNKYRLDFQFGIGAPTDYHVPLAPPEADEWFPVFVPIADIGTINYKRFYAVKDADGFHWYGTMNLPGNLDGQYRWVYTHYDPLTGRESPPSPVSNNGDVLDLSTEGVTGSPGTARAFQKCATISVTSDSGVDSSTTKIRIYRNGGVPSLTKDAYGRDIYFRVVEIFDLTTATGESHNPGDTTFTVTTITNIKVGDVLVIDKGTVGKEEYITVSAINGSTITIVEAAGLQFSHASGASVQEAFIDNVSNESIDLTRPLDFERNNAPSGSKRVERSPEGRLWLFGNPSNPTQVCVSNRATPDRPNDYEVFPDGVDPLTRRSITQGWRFQISGDVSDEEIVWGGFFQGYATVLTKRNIYRIYAQSQLEWSPMAIVKIANVGCISGDTVREVNGVLYWVTDGPRVVRWNGFGGYWAPIVPETISHLRVNVRLNAAPTTLWNQWFALSHTKQQGHYYELYFTPSGQTTNTQRLDFNSEQDAWEPVVYYDANSNPHGWAAAAVRDAFSDVRDLYQVDSNGKVYQAEVGNLDDGVGIQIRATTKKFGFGGATAYVHQVFTRLTGVNDTLTLKVTTDGSEYGQTTHSYTLTLTSGTDNDLKVRLDRDLKGRWVQFQWTGTVNNRPAIREGAYWFVPVRPGKYLSI